MSDDERSDLNTLIGFYKKQPNDLKNHLLKISPTILLKLFIQANRANGVKNEFMSNVFKLCEEDEALKLHWLKKLNSMMQTTLASSEVQFCRASFFQLAVAEYLYQHRSESAFRAKQLEKQHKTDTTEYDELIFLLSTGHDIAEITTAKERHENMLLLNQAAELGSFYAADQLARIWSYSSEEGAAKHQSLLSSWADRYHGTVGYMLLMKYLFSRYQEDELMGPLFLYLTHIATALEEPSRGMATLVGGLDGYLDEYFSEQFRTHQRGSFQYSVAHLFHLPAELYLDSANSYVEERLELLTEVGSAANLKSLK